MKSIGTTRLAQPLKPMGKKDISTKLMKKVTGIVGPEPYHHNSYPNNQQG